MSLLEDAQNLPSCPGVYQMLDKEEAILYVGKAKNIKKRVLSYTKTDQLSLRLKRMVSLIHSVRVIVTETETEALLLECNLIKRHKPPFNILLKDDKSFPFLLVTKDHVFPRVTKHRGKQTLEGDYFGPFADAGALHEMIIHLQKIFRLRNCSDSFFEKRKKPCLQYHLKRCSAPCVKHIDEQAYAESVQQALQFLKGKSDAVQAYLSQKMQEASDALEFERASIYRDRLKMIAKLQISQHIHIPTMEDTDVIGWHREHRKICFQIFIFRFGKHLGHLPFILDLSDDENIKECFKTFLMQFYTERQAPPHILCAETPFDKEGVEKALKTSIITPQRGVKKEILAHATSNAKSALDLYFSKNASMKQVLSDLMCLFRLQDLPKRIEVYDNTHHQGESAYSVMVVANQDGFEKQSYRKFSMDTNDDYAMMRSVMQRRFAHTEWQKPDFMIIDGGLGQLNAVQETLKELNLTIPCVAMSKGVERKVGDEKYIINEFEHVTPSTTLSYFLQKLRDESHRFAIGTHRQSKVKKMHTSVLDEIPGIGPRRKKALLQHFGSSTLIAQATLHDLEAIPGVNKGVAHKIYNFFHQKS